MKETIQDVTHKLFFDICGKKPTDIDIFFLEQMHFPKIDYTSRMTVYIPMSREIQRMETIQGCVFSSPETHKQTIFSLFLASVCHTACHAKVTDFEKYKNWMHGKNKKRAFETFEFIEDIRVNQVLENEFPEYFSEIKKIEEFFNTINNKKRLENVKENSKKIFSDKFVSNIKIQRDEIERKILELDSEDKEKFIQIADIIYESSNIISEQKLPFVDHYSHPKRVEKWVKNITLTTEGRFHDIVERMVGVWDEQLKRKNKVRKKYGGITEDLEFDKVDFAPENIGEYLRLKNSTHMFLKKLSSQIKMAPNIMDDGIPEDMGMLQIPAAIQAVAAQNFSLQIFEQDDYRRIEEEWAIVMDTSSSMNLKFDEMKKLAMCLGEAANEVNAINGKWGFFTFNNNFSIIKDHYENYDQRSKSRIGGIEVKGMSFIADAVKLCSRILDRENIERRYIFLITDGQALGTYHADEKMLEAVEAARKRGISVIAIGMPTGVSKVFSMCMPYEGLRKTIGRFIAAYTQIAGADM